MGMTLNVTAQQQTKMKIFIHGQYRKLLVQSTIHLVFEEKLRKIPVLTVLSRSDGSRVREL